MLTDFFRFSPAPDYIGYPSADPDNFVPNQGEQYPIPARRNDVFRLVINKLENSEIIGIAIGLAKEDEIVVPIVGTITETDSHYWITVTIPANQAFGCYRLVIYGQTDTGTPWTETGYSCETDSFGNRTGFAIVSQTRNATYVPSAVYHSAPIEIGLADQTSYLEFSDDSSYVFGFSYIENPTFIQSVRLHIALCEPKNIVTESQYRDTSGKIRKNNTQIGKKYKLRTAYFEEAVHDALTVACKHEFFKIDGRLMSLEGVFSPEFTELATSVKRHRDMYIATVDVTDEDFYLKNNDCVIDADIVPNCPRQYLFSVTQSVGAELISLNNYTLQLGRLVSMFVSVSPFTQGVTFASDGEIPIGLVLSISGPGLSIIGVPIIAGNYTLILKARNGINTCGQITLFFNAIAPPVTMLDYSEDDYNENDYT